MKVTAFTDVLQAMTLHTLIMIPQGHNITTGQGQLSATKAVDRPELPLKSANSKLSALELS